MGQFGKIYSLLLGAIWQDICSQLKDVVTFQGWEEFSGSFAAA